MKENGLAPLALALIFPPMPSTLTVVSHPLVQHKMALLRSQETPTREFRKLVGELATLLAYEATRDLEVEPVSVTTPLETMYGHRIPRDTVVLVPILRAGLGMVDPMAELFPNAGVGHMGLYRNEETLQPVSYYYKIPPLGPRRSTSCSTRCSPPAAPRRPPSRSSRSRAPSASD